MYGQNVCRSVSASTAGVDVGSGHVPARREAGLVQHDGAGGLGDAPDRARDDEVTRGVPDVDAVVRVRGVAEYAVVLLVEAVHPPPGECDLALENRRMAGERDVLPGPATRAPGTADHLEPSGLAELGVGAAVIGRPQRSLGEVTDREVRDRVAAGLEQQHGIVALHYGAPAELGAHTAPQRLGVQHALRDACHEELSVGVAAEWPLLP